MSVPILIALTAILLLVVNEISVKPKGFAAMSGVFMLVFAAALSEF